jgi:hypothetical protein
VFEKGNLVYSQKRKKAKYFKTLKKDKYLSENFLTMDLETKNINGILEPYCVSIFDGKKAYSFYITEYKGSSVELMKAALNFLLKRKYNKHKVYVHNFSYFDGIFLIKIISGIVEAKNIKPIIRDNKIISLTLNFKSEKNKKSKGYNIEFRDSYLLLTTSLENLGNSLAINKGKLEKKLPFPYRFVNDSNIDYNYVGNVPEFKYYDKISESEYNQLIK